MLVERWSWCHALHPIGRGQRTVRLGPRYKDSGVFQRVRSHGPILMRAKQLLSDRELTPIVRPCLAHGLWIVEPFLAVYLTLPSGSGSPVAHCARMVAMHLKRTPPRVRPTSNHTAEEKRHLQTSPIRRRRSTGAWQRYRIRIAPAVHSWYTCRRHKDCSLW
jgi:hypothetical protein